MHRAAKTLTHRGSIAYCDNVQSSPYAKQPLHKIALTQNSPYTKQPCASNRPQLHLSKNANFTSKIVELRSFSHIRPHKMAKTRSQEPKIRLFLNLKRFSQGIALKQGKKRNRAKIKAYMSHGEVKRRLCITSTFPEFVRTHDTDITRAHA